MNINLIIAALRDRATVFAGRVAGAAEFQAILESSAIPATPPAAWVVPLDDSAEPMNETGTILHLTERFGVFVLLDSTADPRGQTARVDVETVRLDLWKTLLGWEPETNTYPIQYEGGEVIKLDRARLFYRYEFSMITLVTDTAAVPISRPAHDQMALADLTSIVIKTDMIDPAADKNTPPVTDPNLGGYHGGYPGPDGRIEHETHITLPTS